MKVFSDGWPVNTDGLPSESQCRRIAAFEITKDIFKAVRFLHQALHLLQGVLIAQFATKRFRKSLPYEREILPMQFDSLHGIVLRMRLPQRAFPLVDEQEAERHIPKPGLKQLNRGALLHGSPLRHGLFLHALLPNVPGAPHGDDVAGLKRREDAMVHACCSKQRKPCVIGGDINCTCGGIVNPQCATVFIRVPRLIQVEQRGDNTGIDVRGGVDMYGEASSVAEGALHLECVGGQGEHWCMHAEKGADGGVGREGGKGGKGGESGRGKVEKLGFEHVALGECGSGGGGDDVSGVRLEMAGGEESINLITEGGGGGGRESVVENGVAVC